MITISPDKRHFLEDGRPFFYLADTVWAAFYGTEAAEWPVYLRARREQGFNVLQISVLPILHDCEKPLRRVPFAVRPDGSWDLDRPDAGYFAYAVERLREARALGFKICLVMLWGNYVPGNWMSRDHPGVAMAKEQALRFVRFALERFAGLFEFCFLSGDVDFSTPENTDVYLAALREHKRLAPGVLTSLHSAGRNTFVPPELLAAPELDFYVYQSGHDGARLAETHAMSEAFLAYPPRPLVNGEPCYEGHATRVGGRFRAADVLFAFWQSVLCGSVAGFAYGAHGIWSWHRPETAFTNEGWSSLPFSWDEALRLPGAGRVAACAEFFWRARGWEMSPSPVTEPGQGEGATSEMPNTRLARSRDGFLLLLPAPSPVELPFALDGWRLAALAPESRRTPPLRWRALAAGRSRLEMVPFNEALVVAGRREGAPGS